MKKILALVLAAAMMMTVVSAFGAEANNYKGKQNDQTRFGRTAETTITVSNLENDSDTATAIQILEWVGNTIGNSEDNKGGWKLTTTGEQLVGEIGATKKAVIENLLDGIDLTEATKIYNKLKSASGTAMTVSGGTATATGVAAGLYFVNIVASAASSDVIYNPVFVSADYFSGNNSIDVSEATIGSSSVVKKSKIEFDKQAGQGEEPSYQYNDVAPGEFVPFKITTTIPAYGTNYTDPTFKVSDTFSSGLELVVDGTHPFTVTYGRATTSATVTDVVTITGATSTSKTFTVDFADAYLLKADRGVTDVTITYWGKVTDEEVNKNVNPMDNTATLTYSRNPDQTQDVHDITRHYDFSFDGSLLGKEGTTTSELVKVGLDANGEIITSEKKTYHSKDLSPLNGAEFKLTAITGTIGEGMRDTFVTDGDGHITFHGLDAGLYKLEETSAPDGFIKDNTTYYVEIVPTYDTANPDILKSYKVLFGTSSTEGSNPVVTTFTMTNENVGEYSEQVSSSTDADNHAAIQNTQGTELPSTGGIGTTLFYLIGGLMVLGAGIVLVSRRKAEQE